MEENEHSELKERLNKAEYINLDAPDTKTIASLCLYAEEINIDAISSALGCNPTGYHRRGDKVKPSSPPSQIGLWELEAPDNLISLPDKISYLLEKTTSNKSIWDDLASRHSIQLRFAIFLNSWTDGFEIPAERLAEIGIRHWLMGFSVYSAKGDEIVESFLQKKD